MPLAKYETASVERQLIAALRSDVDTLAKQFVDCESTQLTQFADLFVTKEFSTIFLGRLAISELVEFVEYLFIHCVRYIAPSGSSFSAIEPSTPAAYPSYVVSRDALNRGYEIIQLRLNVKRNNFERIFGLYMCYCLYFLQPTNYVAPIRVSVAQLREIHRFAREILLAEELLEPLFCLYRLVDAGAFSITPFETEFNPLLLRRFDSREEDEPSVELAELDNSEDFSILTELSNDGTFKQLSAIHDAYVRMKADCNLDLPGTAATSSGITGDDFDVAGYVKQLCAETKASFNAMHSQHRSSGAGVSSSRTHAGDSARSSRARIRESAYASAAQVLHHASRRWKRKNIDSFLQLDDELFNPSDFTGPSTSAEGLGVASSATAGTPSHQLQADDNIAAAAAKWASPRARMKSTPTTRQKTAKKTNVKTEARDDQKKIVK